MTELLPKKWIDHSHMRVAVLGGGGVGVCAALELARLGSHVDLFERDDVPISRASRVNEGKIHQGFVYGKDDSRRTMQLMLQGALSFESCLSRWIDAGSAFHFSTPFIYAVHHNTMVSVDGLRRHYAACCQAFNDLARSSGLHYLGLDEPASVRELVSSQLDGMFDPNFVTHGFATAERSVDPQVIASHLRRAVLNEPRLSITTGARIVDIRRDSRFHFHIRYDDGNHQVSGPYDQVVNATWEDRLRIDAGMGMKPKRPWLFRHKFGHRVRIALEEAALPSATMVLGSFGDLVNFGPNGFYLHWYPIGMVGSTSSLEIPAAWAEMSQERRYEVFRRSLDQWVQFCPMLGEIDFQVETVDPLSGVIFSWGDTPLDDPDSELHTRYDIGIQSEDGYHTINTGKYTMVPLLAVQVAERVLQLKSSLPPALRLQNLAA